jgi:hypothetical protein
MTKFGEDQILFAFRMQKELRRQIRVAAAAADMTIEGISNKLLAEGLERLRDVGPKGDR